MQDESYLSCENIEDVDASIEPIEGIERDDDEIFPDM
jgi:hypothetical protein